jgi:hypothetical protein
LRSGAAPYRGRIGFAQTQRSAEELAEEKRRDRLARRQLAASPELMAVSVAFLFIFGFAVRFEPVALIFGSLVYGIFGWLLLLNGDAIVGSLIVVALGLTTLALLSERLDLEETSLWWTLPGLLVVTAETAMSYNHYRRREGDISRYISRTMILNPLLVAALSLVLASVIRWLTQVDGRVEWPWYSTTIIVLGVGWFAGLLMIRRTATPAERRRYNPGQRMLPPPS